MKIVRVLFNPKKIAQDPFQTYDMLSKKVLNVVAKKIPVDKASFSRMLYLVGDSFVNQNAKEQMNKKSTWFAESLVSQKANDLAGIIYSILVKLNYDNPSLREKFATNALAIATRVKDPIHIMARANDLKEIYKITAKGSDKHIKVLYQEKRALNDIINNYDKLKQEHRTVSRDLSPIDGYKKKLGAIKFEIGSLLLNKEPILAKNELEGAREIYSQFGEGSYTEKIDKLLNKH